MAPPTAGSATCPSPTPAVAPAGRVGTYGSSMSASATAPRSGVPLPGTPARSTTTLPPRQHAGAPIRLVNAPNYPPPCAVRRRWTDYASMCPAPRARGSAHRTIGCRVDQRHDHRPAAGPVTSSARRDTHLTRPPPGLNTGTSRSGSVDHLRVRLVVVCRRVTQSGSGTARCGHAGRFRAAGGNGR